MPTFNFLIPGEPGGPGRSMNQGLGAKYDIQNQQMGNMIPNEILNLPFYDPSQNLTRRQNREINREERATEEMIDYIQRRTRGEKKIPRYLEFRWDEFEDRLADGDPEVIDLLNKYGNEPSQVARGAVENVNYSASPQIPASKYERVLGGTPIDEEFLLNNVASKFMPVGIDMKKKYFDPNLAAAAQEAETEQKNEELSKGKHIYPTVNSGATWSQEPFVTGTGMVLPETTNPQKLEVPATTPVSSVQSSVVVPKKQVAVPKKFEPAFKHDAEKEIAQQKQQQKQQPSATSKIPIVKRKEGLKAENMFEKKRYEALSNNRRTFEYLGKGYYSKNGEEIWSGRGLW